jgi:predicted naringenin-chalcone synthase
MDALPRILSLATDVPAGRMTQAEVYGALAQHFPRYRERGIRRIFEAADIETRHFVLGREEFDPLNLDAGPRHREVRFIRATV